MTKRTVIAAIWVLGMAGDLAAQAPAQQYGQAMLACLDHLEANMPTIVDAAERSAQRIVDGGALLVFYVPGGAATINSFASEARGRAGGMVMTAATWPGDGRTDPQDVILVDGLATRRAERTQVMREGRARGALVILFGSPASPLAAEADIVIDTGMAVGTAPVVALSDGSLVSPAGTTADITALWTYTGELVAACTRLGRMPAMFLSVFAPGGMDWYDSYRFTRFHRDPPAQAVPAGQLGGDFLAEMRRCLTVMLAQQERFTAAGQLLADAVRAGGRARTAVIGHHLNGQLGLQGDPGVLDGSLTWNHNSGWDVAQLMEELAPGDAFFFVGYYGVPAWDEWEPLRAQGWPSVWVTGGHENPETQTDGRPGEIHIDPGWTYGDYCVNVPGYPIDILPPSGVLQTAALWMVAAETAQALLGPVTAVTDAAGPAVPQATALLPSYPNPFNGTVVVPYRLAVAGPVEVAVCDLAGQEVRALVAGWQGAGEQRVTWDGLDADGRPAASGAYLVRLRGPDGVRTARRVMLVR